MPKEFRMIATDNDESLRHVLCDDNGITVNENHSDFHNHLGHAFSVSSVIEDLDAAHAYDMILSTGTSCEIHLLTTEFYVSGASHAYIFEGLVYTMISVPLTPVCLNRTVTGSSCVTVATGSTETSSIAITTTGDLLFESHFPADVKKNVTALGDVGVEMILKPHTNYLIRIDNEDDADIIVSSFLTFIDHG